MASEIPEDERLDCLGVDAFESLDRLKQIDARARDDTGTGYVHDVRQLDNRREQVTSFEGSVRHPSLVRCDRPHPSLKGAGAVVGVQFGRDREQSILSGLFRIRRIRQQTAASLEDERTQLTQEGIDGVRITSLRPIQLLRLHASPILL